MEEYVPTHLTHGAWGADLPNCMLYARFEKSSNVPYKRDVQNGGGTRAVIMEKNRMQLLEAVQQFLDEPLKPGM